MNRRSFLATLGGAIAGTLIGPLESHAPTPELWKAAPSLPKPPVRNFYVPLEVVCARTLEILNQELKWLRLKQHHGCSLPRNYFVATDWWRYAVREAHAVPMTLTSLDGESKFNWEPALVERSRLIDINLAASVDINLEDQWDRPLGEVSVHQLEPAAYRLAEEIIRGIRRSGGGEHLVTVDQELPPLFDKALIVSNQDLGLSIRALEWHGIAHEDPHLRLDMLYGVG